MKFNSLKIKSKMQVSFITAVIIVMVGTAFFTFQLMKKSITQNLKSSLEVLSHIAVDAVTSGLEFNDSEEIASAAKTFTNQDIVSYISVRDNTGNEVFQYRKQGLSDLQDRENIEKISDEMFTKAFVKSEGKQIGAVTIGISLKERNKVLASSNIITAILLLAVVAILLVVTNFIANMISKPINEITVIAEEMARGKLNQEISIQGEDEIGRLAGSFRDMLQTLLAKADAAEQISQGNINVDIQVASDEDILGKAMVMIKKSLKTLQEELSSTIDAQKAGDIDARTQPAKLQGAYSELSSGVNEVLESIILPLLEVVDILKEYANGDLHREMRELPGKQIVLTNSINDIRNNLIFLVEEAKMLADSALEGDLNNRGDVDKFFGDYGKLVQGINDILNAVVKPVKEIIDGIDRIANKDLTTRMTSEYKGDFDKLKQNFNVSMQNLDEALLQVAEVTEQISSTSNQISSGSQNLAEGANEQASSLEEVSSSLEEMSAMTQQNADNASQARNMSKDTRQSAENGNKAMEKMKDAINKI
ncbi:MAG TPA: hypothetical protein DHW42_04970, partial [Candidatus Marinimicrobia bacterium]|nr:hypothetical protein [Candidatus Neomarinimicrobiota bacterium]